ncbi:MAG: type II toxin-antitoxin system PemK/MazF family toxin [Chloroflexi bacterium]|nr:type II toxin-antitoxin system PemK/MazF family toxin [Chloroflexota bacterium]
MTQEWQWRLFMARLDPAAGSEQAGTRPVLVVSEEDYNEVMPVVTVLPLTSRKPGRRVYPNEALIKRGTAGLTVDSIVLAHQVRTISKRRLGAELGFLDNAQLRRRVVETLKGHLGIE